VDDHRMTVEVVFETHSVSVDNERGVATGWLPGTLSARGRALAVELGQRRRNDGLVAIFTSDLGRAVETVKVAFAGSGIPVFVDWRLRECDYGELNGAPKAVVHGERGGYRRTPYPGGESWEQATGRAERVLDDLATRWSGRRILVVGHLATRLALEQRTNGADLGELLERDVAWQQGWDYRLDSSQ